MATNPTPGACLKCNTPLVPGAAFCGTCGTPAGSPGRPPMPPPMPPRPMPYGARQVVVPMDQPQALQAAMSLLPRVGGEITNQSPVQIAFRTGNFMTGRHTGTIDTFPEGPARTAMNVTLKPDHASLIPAGIVLLATTMILWVVLAKSSVDQMYVVDWNNPYQMRSPGIGAYIQWWMVLLFDALVLGLAFWLLGGPMLDSRKAKLMSALQGIGAVPPGMPGTVQQGFGAQVVPPVPAVGAPAAPAPGGPAPASPFDQLRKLAELRDSGAITADDFEKAKADIMKRLT